MERKTLDAWRNEYVGTVFGASAFSFVVYILTVEATDDFKEEYPALYRHEIKKIINKTVGDGQRQGVLQKLRSQTKLLMNDKRIGMAWLDDFGNSVYAQIETHVQRMQVAIANVLGKYPKVFDRNIAAKMIIAQSLANEQAQYVERRTRAFTRFSIQTETSGRKENVGSVLQRLSCRPAEQLLRQLAFELLEHALPDDVDITADRSVQIGAKAMFNKLADKNTWNRARDDADRLNNYTEQQKDTNE